MIKSVTLDHIRNKSTMEYIWVMTDNIIHPQIQTVYFKDNPVTQAPLNRLVSAQQHLGTSLQPSKEIQ